VPGATVRIQTADAYTISDGQGQFAVHADDVAYITAWASGYYIAGVEANPGKDVEIYLEAHTAEDNPEYEWLPSTYHSGVIVRRTANLILACLWTSGCRMPTLKQQETTVF
jgi:hypothetical protein